MAAARRSPSSTWTACVCVVRERVGVLPVGAGSVGWVMQQAIEPTMQSISTCCRQGGLADRGGYTTPGAANSPPARESCGVCTQGATTRHVRQSQEAAAWHKSGVVGASKLCAHGCRPKAPLKTGTPSFRLTDWVVGLPCCATAAAAAQDWRMQQAWSCSRRSCLL